MPRRLLLLLLEKKRRILVFYITGRCPPVIHLKNNCFGILFKPTQLDPDKYTTEELEKILSNCEPCCICASRYTGNKEVRRKELEGLGK